MLQLRVFGAHSAMTEVVERLTEIPGARHITWTDAGGRTQEALVSADLHADAADPALAAVRRLGVEAAEDVSLLRIDAIQPHGRRREQANLVLGRPPGTGRRARPAGRALPRVHGRRRPDRRLRRVYDNVTLIVGAMAVSPDLLPITSICVGLVLRRWQSRGARS